MNKRMAFIVILVTAVLLYDLVFHTTCVSPEQCYFLVHLAASVLYSHVIMAAISKLFPTLQGCLIVFISLQTVSKLQLNWKSVISQVS